MKKYLLQETHQANGLHPQIKTFTMHDTFDECVQIAREESIHEYNACVKLKFVKPGDVAIREVNNYRVGEPIIHIYNDSTEETFAWFITELDV